MRTKRWTVTLGLSAILIASIACQFNVSTANISGLKLGKDKNATPETNSFDATDTVYALAVVSNAPSKLKVKGALAVEDVEGQKPGPIPGLETTVDLPGSGTATFNFSPPSDGWPKGKYRIDVIMLNEDGQQKDQKTATFTVP